MRRVASALAHMRRMIATHPLTRDRQLEAWRRFAVWTIASRLSRELTVPWLEGQRLVVRRGMTGASGNLYLGLHEFMSMMLTVHFLRPSDLFLDIGANVGTYAVLASGVSGADTWAFEPDEEAGRDLMRNVAVNGLERRVTLHAVALGPADGSISFTCGQGAMNRVVAAGEAPAAQGVRTVAQRRLDALTAGRAPAMMKIDAEGYEEQVLQGALATLANPSLKVIAVEGTTPAMLQLFNRNDFERAFYDPFTRGLQRTPNSLAYSNGEWTLSNEFYVRDWAFVEARLSSARAISVMGRSV